MRDQYVWNFSMSRASVTVSIKHLHDLTHAVIFRSADRSSVAGSASRWIGRRATRSWLRLPQVERAPAISGRLEGFCGRLALEQQREMKGSMMLEWTGIA